MQVHIFRQLGLRCFSQFTLWGAWTLLCILAANTVYAQSKTAKISSQTMEVLQKSFMENGQAKLDRLVLDETNEACSVAAAQGKPLSAKARKALEAINMKTIKAPSDGKYLGDWKEGEKIAQNGRGATWSDKADTPAGGNCYNCHQISKKETAFGTIGPSLFNFGKLRGVTDPNSPQSKAMLEYTWGKIYNSKAYNACSNMPRFGHAGVLSEMQIKHLVALLLDPASPVNE